MWTYMFNIQGSFSLPFEDVKGFVLWVDLTNNPKIRLIILFSTFLIFF